MHYIVERVFQGGISPVESDEPKAAPAVEPETSGRRTSMEPPAGSETAWAEGRPEPDSLSAAGDRASEMTESTEGKIGQESESSKYIEKRGYIPGFIFAGAEICR